MKTRFTITIVFLFIFSCLFSQNKCGKCFQELTGSNVEAAIAKTTEYRLTAYDSVLKEIHIAYYNKFNKRTAELTISPYQSDSISYVYNDKCLVERKEYRIAYSMGQTVTVDGNFLKKDSLMWVDYGKERNHVNLFQHDTYGALDMDRTATITSVVDKDLLDRSSKHIVKRFYQCNDTASQYIGLDSLGNVVTNREYIFNKKGDLTHKNLFNSITNSNYIFYEYDSIGNRIKWSGYTKYENENYVLNYRSASYKYTEFDDHGNWTVAYYRDRKIIRKIEYYE